MSERKHPRITEHEDDMTPHEAASAAVRTSAQVAADRAAAMAAGSGMPSHDTGTAHDAKTDSARRVAELTEELAQMRDSTLRARADFENTRKRLLREKEEGIRYANSTLIEKLLPVFDSFELGLVEAKKHKGAGPIVKGFELVWKQMAEFLKENGVEPIDAEGQGLRSESPPGSGPAGKRRRAGRPRHLTGPQGLQTARAPAAPGDGLRFEGSARARRVALSGPSAAYGCSKSGRG